MAGRGREERRDETRSSGLRPRLPPAPPSQGEEEARVCGAAAPLQQSLKVRGEGRRFPRPPSPSPPPRVLPTSAVFSDYATHCRPQRTKPGAAAQGPTTSASQGSHRLSPWVPAPSLDAAPLWSSRSHKEPWRRVPPAGPGPLLGPSLSSPSLDLTPSGSRPVSLLPFCCSLHFLGSLCTLGSHLVPHCPFSQALTPVGAFPRQARPPGRVPGHPPRDTCTATRRRPAASLMLVTAVVLKAQGGSHSLSHKTHTQHGADSGLFRATCSDHQPWRPLPGWAARWPRNTCSHPDTLSARVSSHMGAQWPQSHGPM